MPPETQQILTVIAGLICGSLAVIGVVFGLIWLVEKVRRPK